MSKSKKPAPAEPTVFPLTDIPESPKETITKSEAIRRAIKAGFDKPQAGCAWIQQQYDLYVNPQTFSSVKNEDRVAAGKTNKPKTAPSGPSVHTAKKVHLNGLVTRTTTLEMVRQIRVLVDQHGADAVKEAVAVFAD